MSRETVRLAACGEAGLRVRARSRTLPAGEVRRARLILMLAEGKSYQMIQAELPCDATFMCVGSSAFCRTVCPDCTRATPVAQCKSGSRKWKPGFWSWRAERSARGRATEAADNCPRT